VQKKAHARHIGNKSGVNQSTTDPLKSMVQKKKKSKTKKYRRKRSKAAWRPHITVRPKGVTESFAEDKKKKTVKGRAGKTNLSMRGTATKENKAKLL